jgi:hypothetical protein
VLRLWLRHEVIRHNGQFPALAPSHCSGANAPSRTSGTQIQRRSSEPENGRLEAKSVRLERRNPPAACAEGKNLEKPAKPTTSRARFPAVLQRFVETGPRHGRGSFLASGSATGAARATQKQNRTPPHQSEVCGPWRRYSALTRQARRLLCARCKRHGKRRACLVAGGCVVVGGFGGGA